MTPLSRACISCYHWIVLIASCALVGCQSPRTTRIELTTFDAKGAAKLHYSEFRRASYRMSPGNELELVFRSERPSSIDPTQAITQIVYIKSFWKSIPGTTYADSSQINARVQYALLTPPTGMRYDGSAFIHYGFQTGTGRLVGTLEDGTLSPRYRMGDAADPLGPCRFSGKFVATENPGDVVNAAQMLGSQFNQPVGSN